MSRARRLKSAARLHLEVLEQRTLFSAGALDPSFGVGGRVTTDFFAANDVASAVALQADGNIVMVGRTDSGGGQTNFAIARYHPNGSLDLSFSNDGLVATDFFQGADQAADVAIQGDSKIVVVGMAVNQQGVIQFALARYNPDGTLDLDFGANGKVVTDFASVANEAQSVVIQPDGKIVVFGTVGGAFGLARFNADGSPDSTFGGDGLVITSFSPGATTIPGHGVALQADGKIVVVGRVDKSMTLVRYLSNGDLDSTFGGTGVVFSDFSSLQPGVFQGASGDSVAIQDDGRIVVAGEAKWGSQSYFALARYLPDGSSDADFDADGKLVTGFFPEASSYARAVAVQSDGKIVASGVSHNGVDFFAAARFKADGTLDKTFSSDGKVRLALAPAVSSTAAGMVLQPDGKIVIAGYVFDGGLGDFALVRLQGSVGLNIQAFSDQLTLFINGDSSANHIEVIDDGARGISVLENGHLLGVFTDIQKVVASLGAGDDTLTMSAHADTGAASAVMQKVYQADMGLGNDHLNVDMDAQSNVGSLSFTLGGGDDTLDLRIGNPNPPAGTPGPDDRQLLLNIAAGAGNDQVNLTFFDIFANTWAGRVDLGLGNDSFQGTFDIDDLGPGTRQIDPGNFTIGLDVLGQQGNDTMGLLVGEAGADPSPHLLNSHVRVNLDGGAGDDNFVTDVANASVNGLLEISANGGAGNDTMDLWWGKSILNGSTTVNLFGGTGSDTVGFIWFENVAAGATAINTDAGSGADSVGIVIDGCNVAAGASVMFDVDGGDGSDAVGIVIDGCTVARDALIGIDAHGGGSADVLRLASNGVAIAEGGKFDACLEGNGGNDVLDTSSSAYGTGVYHVEMAGNDGADTVGFILLGGKWESGAALNIEMSGDGGGDSLSIGGIMPCWEPGAKWEMTAAGNDGNDVIRGSLQFLDAIGGSASFAFAGGRGDDQVMTDMMPSVLPGGELHVALDGDDGNDTLFVTLRDAHMDGLFDLDLNGGLGADGLFLGGIMPCIRSEAQFKIHLTGDAGNDRLEAHVAFEPEFLGTLDFSMDGGLGDDRLTGLVPTDSWFGMGPRIDGGLGRDAAFLGRNLLPFVVNCEQVTPI